MNPYDAVGTARISSALYDRTCRIAMGYQSETAEGEIVSQRTDGADAGVARAGGRGWSATPATTRTSGSARRSAARSTWSA